MTIEGCAHHSGMGLCNKCYGEIEKSGNEADAKRYKREKLLSLANAAAEVGDNRQAASYRRKADRL